MWVKISDDNGGIFALEGTPDPQQVVSVDELNAQIIELDSELEVVNAEPDEILMPNMEKLNNIQVINMRKWDLEKILNDLGV